jgi:membrane-associated phospholipid phosphatase
MLTPSSPQPLGRTDIVRSRADALENPRTAFAFHLLLAAGALACLGLLALTIDLPVAAWCKGGHLPRELMRIMNLSEIFAHGTGATILLITALVLDPSLAMPTLAWPQFQPRGAQQEFARMIAAVTTGGLLADGVKLIVDRVRPRAADLALHSSVLDTFAEAAVAAVTGSRADINSFPSGHAAVAAALAAALSWHYPRGRLLFWLFALSASLQRVATSAHFPSDICFGAAVGLLGAAIFLRSDRKPASP